MNKIFTEEAKSFRFIRPSPNKKILTYTKQQIGTIFLPLVTEEADIFNAVKNLCGPQGAIKSFYRYYFPKRFIFQSTLYVKPRVIDFIDEKAKKRLVSDNLKGFRGIPKNKLFDKRNVIIDYSDLLKLAIPTDHMYMTRPTVIQYVEDIIPEIMCYILFFNKDHQEVVDPEFNKEELKREMEFNTENYSIDEDMDSSNEGMSFEEFHETMWDKIKSDEAFVEKLFAKTKIFSMGGPVSGLDQYGYNKYVISFKMNLKIIKYFSKNYLTGDLPIMRFIKVNPELIYQISMFRFLYKAYVAYFTGEKSDNAFINEFIGKEVAFHIWCESGLGFVMNFDELKNVLKYKPDRFVRKLSSALSILAFKNVGTLNDKDIDKFENEENEKEFDSLTSKIATEPKDTGLISKLKSNLMGIVDKDYKLQTVNNIVKSEDETPSETIIEDDNIENIKIQVDTTDKAKSLTSTIPFKANIMATQAEMNELMKITSKFSENKAKDHLLTVKSDDPDLRDVSFSVKELDDILNEPTNTDEDIVEDNVDDDTSEEETDAVTTEESTATDDGINVSNIPGEVEERQNEDGSDPDFDLKYGAFNDGVVEEEEDDTNDYIAITPKKNANGPIKVKDAEKEKVLSPADQKRLNLLKNKYKSLTINGKSITETVGNANNIDIEKFEDSSKESIRIKDKSILNITLSDYQKSYVKNNYEADIVNVVRSLSKDKEVPLYITKANAEDTSDQFTDKITYSFQLKDEFNKTHNLTFDVPKLSDEGLMKINGSMKYLKKQLIRKPIVKIAPDQVYITTELNSFRVERYDGAFNRGSEIIRKLINEYFIDNPGMAVERGSCLEDNKDYLTTLEYDVLAKNYFVLDINANSKYGSHIQVIFSQKRIRKLIEELHINTGYKNDIIPDNVLPVAIDLTKKALYSIDMSKNSSVNSTIISCINEALHDQNLLDFIKKVKLPKRRIYSRVEIQSKVVPLITFLNYTFGWKRVASYFPENQITFSEKRELAPNQLCIKFYDGYLYYNQYPLNGAILLNGLSILHTEDYKYEDLNNPMIYLNFLQELKYQTKNIVKGWKTVKESMLDYKTLQILEALGQPTDLLEVFLYCNDLLIDNQLKRESDISNYRIRGNEIVAECLYKVVTDRYNVFKKRAGKKLTVSIPKNAVMSKVYATEILENYDCLSPMAEIKNGSSTTFKGPGGTKLEQAFTKEKRAFDPSYVGIFGISTPDNHTAGVVKELTINPKITNTLGFLGKQDEKTATLNDVTTSEEALTPFVNTMDDPSRIAFVSIQNTHVGGLPDSSLPTVRTGIEKIVQLETGNTFIMKAKMTGVVDDINEITKKVFVSYKDGTKECFDYNNQMLKNSDAFNQNEYACVVKIGQKLKKDDPVIVDSRFFKRDPITKELIYTQAANAMVAIMEGGYTEDDSNLIMESFSSKLRMNFTKRKQISIKPDDSLISYRNVGDDIQMGDSLIVFDESGALSMVSEKENEEFDDLFSDLNPDTLTNMIHQTPRAPISGKILDMRVYWTVPVEKMSPSIAKFVKEYINRIKKEIVEEEKFTKKPSAKRNIIAVTDVTKGMSRINGVEIDRGAGGIVIEYFIGGDDIMSNGDKIALFSSLKSVNSVVVDRDLEPYAAESGDHVDCIFSFISCEARMINSVYPAGCLGKLLHDYSKQWATECLKDAGKVVPSVELEDMRPDTTN